MDLLRQPLSKAMTCHAVQHYDPALCASPPSWTSIRFERPQLDYLREQYSDLRQYPTTM